MLHAGSQLLSHCLIMALSFTYDSTRSSFPVNRYITTIIIDEQLTEKERLPLLYIIHLLLEPLRCRMGPLTPLIFIIPPAALEPAQAAPMREGSLT